ncbi:beta-galactosidase [Klebsiella aerogenes]|nr:beta-galactosidase [Klebsiella aerogenes]
MRNRAGNTIHFLFNYSGEALDVVSETAGTALLSGEAVDVGQPLRLRAWEFTIIES